MVEKIIYGLNEIQYIPINNHLNDNFRFRFNTQTDCPLNFCLD
jgi:hypothetical protein